MLSLNFAVVPTFTAKAVVGRKVIFFIDRENVKMCYRGKTEQESQINRVPNSGSCVSFHNLVGVKTEKRFWKQKSSNFVRHNKFTVQSLQANAVGVGASPALVADGAISEQCRN